MTIGPAPMIRIEEMSVRLGMSLGDIWARPRHKKRARCLRVLRAAQRCVPARGRSLDQNQRAGKGSLKITGKTGKITGKTGRPDNMRGSRPPRDKGHARLVVADIGGGAARRKSAAGELGDHRRLAIAREAEIEAQPPIVGDKGAQ